MGKKAKAKKVKNETIFEVGKRYVIRGPQGGLEEVVVSEVAQAFKEGQIFAINPAHYMSDDCDLWRYSNDFEIAAELPAKAKKEGTE